MWLSGQGLIVILLSDSFRIELSYYISVALKASARFCLWGRPKLSFPWISGHKGLWPVSAASSVPCALKGGRGTASCSPACRLLQASRKKTPGRFRISATELGRDAKIESGERGWEGLRQQQQQQQQAISGWHQLERAFVPRTVGRVTARWLRNPRAGEEILDRGKAHAEFLFSTVL